ncbi:MAG: CapA family protein [Lachnospiraceae bacterium]|nr:CapA family protein [Lachnospiraceae bacterium]
MGLAVIRAENSRQQCQFHRIRRQSYPQKIYEYGLIRKKGNFDFLYEPFREEIAAADLSALNMETPLVENPRMYGDYPSFGTPKEVGEAVSEAGFDIVSCANNHCLDRGMTGIDTVAELCEDSGITCCGIQKSGDREYRPYELVSKKGIRFAIFSYTYGINGNDVSEKYPCAVHMLSEYGARLKEEGGAEDSREADRASFGTAADQGSFGITDEQLRADISRGKAEADIAVVFIHWGTEYEKEPDEVQKYYAKLLNEAGADVVIGSHPHVIQPAEVLRNENGQETLVAYSLGNFRSAQSGEDTRMGGELCFTVEHTFDGIRITGWALKEIDSFVKSK